MQLCEIKCTRSIGKKKSLVTWSILGTWQDQKHKISFAWPNSIQIKFWLLMLAISFDGVYKIALGIHNIKQTYAFLGWFCQTRSHIRITHVVMVTSCNAVMTSLTAGPLPPTCMLRNCTHDHESSWVDLQWKRHRVFHLYTSSPTTHTNMHAHRYKCVCTLGLGQNSCFKASVGIVS